MATASVDSCLKHTPPCRKAEMQLFFFFPAFIFLSLHSVPPGLPRALRKAVIWQTEKRQGVHRALLVHRPAFPICLQLSENTGDSSPRRRGMSGCMQAGLVSGALDSSALCSANKSADSASITAILRFQNFLPPLPKYKGTFVLNTELEHWWAPCRAPCGIWFLATVHVFIMMGEGKEGSCSYQHANNLLQRTGALRAN